jgi:beta-glucosidase
LDAYEDPRQTLGTRVDDLIGQMTLEQKAGTLFINGAAVNADGSIEDKPGRPGFAGVAITQRTNQKVNHFNLW